MFPVVAEVLILPPTQIFPHGSFHKCEGSSPGLILLQLGSNIEQKQKKIRYIGLLEFLELYHMGKCLEHQLKKLCLVTRGSFLCN